MQFTPTLHKLSNGLPVILDPMDIETACMSISIGAGSRNESPAECGISHFLEHMLCAGTKTAGRDSFTKMLNQAKDRGGSINASTSDSRTRFYGRILSENFEFLCDILPDMVLNSTLLPENIERERGVIHQELKRALDNSERQFGILVDEKLFAGTGLEHMVLGKAETISSISRENLMDYYGRHYSSGNTIIGISGKFDADRVLAALEKVVGKISARDIPAVVPTKLSPTIHYETREDKNQTKVLIGFEDSYPDEKAYDFQHMCQGAFRSALSTRLFDEVREKNGLVYNIGTSGIGDEFVSANVINTSLSPDKLEKAMAIISRVCGEIMGKSPVSEEELVRWKMSAKLHRANFLESAGSRRDRLIGHWRRFAEMYNPAEYDALREKITADDVAKYSADFFNHPMSIIAMGPKIDFDMKSVWENNFQ